MINNLEIIVTEPGTLRWPGGTVPCALGKAGVTARKREGDHKTPLGCFTLRRVFYRPDKMAAPETALPVQPLRPDDGWCDDAASPSYNQLVRLPFAHRCEALWRSDNLYDVVVDVGYNTGPVIGGAGSAIFIHIAKPGYEPTEGCIALARDDLLALLADCGPQALIRIRPALTSPKDP